ncbi:kinesin [Diplogelasinospora grovesii]|uniref:Kinesin n=1 Tax=Diplogelasinospora grovesii TaxID=303347 RepID=A0AAN6S0U1_9PEZI|nr:kinesin [Diplogelasinospora grovesii]
MTEPRQARGLRLLCLDGGGVRGLSSLLILQRIVENINPSEPPKPCDYFDMICGTSTGGLIAIMLGRLGLSVSDCILEYKKLSSSVFTKCRHRLNWKGKLQGRFDHEALEEGVKNMLRRLDLPEDALLKEADEKLGCKVFVCSMSQQTSDIVIFSNYYSKTSGASMLNRVRIWEAARATSATPSFFEPVVVDKMVFEDGATGANNPIFELWAEASSLYRPDSGNETWNLEDELDCLVSIGRGMPSLRPFGPGVVDVAKALKAIATAAEKTAERFQRHHERLVKSGVFFRFNVSHGLEDIGLEEASRLGDIQACTDRYCTSPSVVQRVEACANKLKRRPWIPEAIFTFENRLEPPYLRDLYNSQSKSYEEYDLQRFMHTKAFQEWLAGCFSTMICTTFYNPDSSPSALAACLSKFLEINYRYQVLYVDCFWILQAPAQARVQELREDGRTPATTSKAAPEDDSSNDVLRSLYSQLFRRTPGREKILEGYHETLPPSEAALFRAWISANGVPPQKHLALSFEFLLRSSPQKLLISVDRIHLLGESSRTRLIALLSAATHKTGVHIPTLFCGHLSTLKIDRLYSVALKYLLTSLPKCLTSLFFPEINVRKSQVSPAANGTASWIWSHPVYRAFTAEDSGILWMRGKPGSGKSVLARAIQRRLLDTSSLIGDWFYHRRRGGDFVRHESFVRSVLYHFLQQSPGLFGNSTRIVCIIDAVDEAENANVISVIRSIVDSGPTSRAKFIVLSRPNAQIEREIDDRPWIVVEDENARDIERITDLSLASLQAAMHSLDFRTSTSSSHRPSRPVRPSNIRQLRHRPLANTKNREKMVLAEIRSILISKARGSILWLIQEAHDNAGSTLDEFKDIVDKYYRQIANALTAHKPQKRIEELRRALMWICAAAEGLWEALAILDDIWQRQMSVTSYDELWRKIYTICGPFIEIFNPGLSAEESRVYHYGPSSIVQLMHQSVRDFFCDSNAAGALTLVHKHLENYLRLTKSDYHRFEQIVDWLNEQRLLRLAIKGARALQWPVLQDLKHTGAWALRPPPEGSDELLLRAEDDHENAGTDRLLAVGRLFYHTCSEGLVTAVENMHALDWRGRSDTPLTRGDMVTSCIFFAAFKSGSSKFKIEVELPGIHEERLKVSAESPTAQLRDPPFPYSSDARRSSYMPKIHSPLRHWLSANQLDVVTARPRSVRTAPPYQTTEDAEAADKTYWTRRRGGESGIGVEGGEKTAAPGKAERPAWDELPAWDTKNTRGPKLSPGAALWVDVAWPVKITISKDDGSIVQRRVMFERWCSFLDLICGSKNMAIRSRISSRLEHSAEHQRIETQCAETEENDDDDDAAGMFPIEDVEDAVVAALEKAFW